jgi:hypothetical protein
LSKHVKNHVWRYTVEEIHQFEDAVSAAYVKLQRRGLMPVRGVITAITEVANGERAEREEQVLEAIHDL